MNEGWKQWKFAGIYCIQHIESGKRYIGQSKNLYKRINAHIKHNGSLHYLYNAINRYGIDAFNICLLERIYDENLFDEREQHWIDRYNSSNSNYGYNLRKIASSNRGCKLVISEEGAKKLDEVRRRNNLNRQRKICQLDKDTDAVIKIWNNLVEVSMALHIPKSGIHACCNGKLKTYHEYKWKYFDESTNELKNRTNFVDRRIYQIDRNTNEIIKEWSCQAEAVVNTGIDSGSISSCCKNKRKTAGNYKWKYADEERLNKNVARSNAE